MPAIPGELGTPYEISSWGMVKAIGDESDEDDWLISGPIASTKPDYDGDTVFSKAVEMGLGMFDKMGGQVDWMHRFNKSEDPDDIVGRAVGYTKVNGQIWLTTLLDKSNALSKKIWRMVKAKKADGTPLHKMGYSLLGKGIKDDRGNVVETEIHFVTLAPQPKGFDQFVQVGAAPGRVFQICKAVGSEDDGQPIEAALTTGSGVVGGGDTGGATLRSQFLKGGSPEAVGPDLESLDLVGIDGKSKKKRRRRRRVISKAMLDRLTELGCDDPEEMADKIMGLVEQRHQDMASRALAA